MIIPRGNYLNEFKKEYSLEIVPVSNLRQAMYALMGN